MSEVVVTPRSPEMMSRADTALLVVDVQDKLVPAIPDHQRVAVVSVAEVSVPSVVPHMKVRMIQDKVPRTRQWMIGAPPDVAVLEGI